MRVQAIDTVIKKLASATQPMSVEKQQAFAKWLTKYTHIHDERLIDSVFMEVVEEAKQEKMI